MGPRAADAGRSPLASGAEPQKKPGLGRSPRRKSAELDLEVGLGGDQLAHRSIEIVVVEGLVEVGVRSVER